ncbi:MAG: hypothetical protein V1847_04500 [Candidatus Diapherotrites archaeon]
MPSFKRSPAVECLIADVLEDFEFVALNGKLSKLDREKGQALLEDVSGSCKAVGEALKSVSVQGNVRIVGRPFWENGSMCIDMEFAQSFQVDPILFEKLRSAEEKVFK